MALDTAQTAVVRSERSGFDVSRSSGRYRRGDSKVNSARKLFSDDRRKEPVMRPTKAAAVVAIVVTLTSISVGDLMTVSAQGGGGQKIAFQSNRDGNNFEIYTMNVDGSDVRQLTTHTAVDVDPVWSPDGSRIAFVSGRDGNGEIYVMNADGSDLTRLTNHPAVDTSPEWSPDGQRIAFTSDRYVTQWGVRVTGIYIMNADGSNVTPTNYPPSGDFEPAWSPDGQKIAFQSNRFGSPVYPTDDIWVMNIDGSGIARLTNRDGFDGLAAWSPDGSQIAFNGGNGIHVMNADGSQTRFLTAGARPAWSSDGSKVAFEDTRDGGPCCTDGVYNVELYTINADGSDVRRLTRNPAYDQRPDWSR
jgi:Tol biopolymer transport system component